jgi:hypothetical protein
MAQLAGSQEGFSSMQLVTRFKQQQACRPFFDLPDRLQCFQRKESQASQNPAALKASNVLTRSGVNVAVSKGQELGRPGMRREGSSPVPVCRARRRQSSISGAGAGAAGATRHSRPPVLRAALAPYGTHNTRINIAFSPRYVLPCNFLCSSAP